MSANSPTPSSGPIVVVPFASHHSAAFRDLNVAWITEHWELEPKDLETLDHPQYAILDRGGAILIAEEGSVAVGCVAMIPYGNDGTLELAKMAVSASHRGRRVGRLLMEHAISHARSVGAPRLFLESNTRLAPAIHLYETAGFRRIPETSAVPSPYTRCNIAMELNLQTKAGVPEQTGRATT